MLMSRILLDLILTYQDKLMLDDGNETLILAISTILVAIVHFCVTAEVSVKAGLMLGR